MTAKEVEDITMKPKHEEIKSMFDYGDKVVDTVTGFIGTVTAFSHYFGKEPNKYLVEGIDSTGRPMSDWYNEERLEYRKARG